MTQKGSFAFINYNLHIMKSLHVCLAALTVTAQSGGRVFQENELTAIPTFVIIGAAKGGTTDLYYQLIDAAINLEPSRDNPPLLSSKKEIRMLHKPIDATELLLGSKTMGQYLELIRHPCATVKEVSLVRACLASRPRQYTIDASPMYLSSPFTPLNLRAMDLGAKILVMLRDPLETLESLYVHRVVKEGRWNGTSLNTLAEDFLDFIRTNATHQRAFAALTACNDTACQEQGWRDMAAIGLMDTLELRLFANSLYVYSLAAWRRHYFQPGRVMVIDSHAYYRDRPSTMEQVIRFLYGREMIDLERDTAESAPPQNTHRQSAAEHPSLGLFNWEMSSATREKVAAFFHEHVQRRLFQTLAGMQEEGAWIVGFDSRPWPWTERRDELA